MRNRVIVIAPGRKTRGGITTVVKAYENSPLWGKWNCHWIETYRDTTIFIKICFFIRAFFQFLFLLPCFKIVHIHFSWSTSALRKFPFFIISKLFGKRVLVHLHSGDDMIINAKYQYIYRTIFANADQTIVLAENIKKSLQNKYNFKKITVVYNPCPEVTIDTISRLKKKEILFAATLYHIKGYADLIAAFALIALKFPEWKIIFAGNGELDKAKRIVESLKIGNQVCFNGWVFEDEKVQLFSSASIFCLPSYTEGFPMAVLDAWAYGLPVIATPVGGLPDIMEDGVNGLVFKIGDVKGLSVCLEKLILNQKLREELSKNSILLSKTTFNIQTIASQIDKIYSELV
jgi:glycosyltransferase involved in cell wall biosynthesis